MAPVTRLSLAAIVALAVAGACAGCKDTYIRNTDVPDTDENRRIIAFCETYRKAVEAKRIAELLELASPDYYDNGGNVDASDDIDHAGLEEYLLGKFGEASGLRYEIRYRRVVESEDSDLLYVDYTYSASYRIKNPDGEDTWRTTVQENRLELIPDGESFKIVSGM